MDPRYDTYFSERLDEYTRIPRRTLRSTFGISDAFDSQAHYMARSAIDRALRLPQLSRQRLRGDAELLLYLAFSELVARPVIAVQGPIAFAGDRLRGDPLTEDIAADIATITATALDNQDQNVPVSAHRIVDVTSGLWTQLRSANWGLWDG